MVKFSNTFINNLNKICFEDNVYNFNRKIREDAKSEDINYLVKSCCRSPRNRIDEYLKEGCEKLLFQINCYYICESWAKTKNLSHNSDKSIKHAHLLVITQEDSVKLEALKSAVNSGLKIDVDLSFKFTPRFSKFRGIKIWSSRAERGDTKEERYLSPPPKENTTEIDIYKQKEFNKTVRAILEENMKARGLENHKIIVEKMFDYLAKNKDILYATKYRKGFLQTVKNKFIYIGKTNGLFYTEQYKEIFEEDLLLAIAKSVDESEKGEFEKILIQDIDNLDEIKEKQYRDEIICDIVKYIIDHRYMFLLDSYKDFSQQVKDKMIEFAEEGLFFEKEYSILFGQDLRKDFERFKMKSVFEEMSMLCPDHVFKGFVGGEDYRKAKENFEGFKT